MAVVEQELLDSRRAWPQAQAIFAGTPLRRLASRVEVGWHGNDVDSETGACAVVRDGAGLDDLIGEVIRVSIDSREAFVWVRGSRGVPHDISLTRRAMLSLGLLTHESIACVIEVIA